MIGVPVSTRSIRFSIWPTPGMPRARAVGALRPPGRRLAGTAGFDRLSELVHPAAVMGEHAEGLEYFYILPAARIGAFDELIDVSPELLDCIGEPRLFLRDVLGDQI